MLLYIVLALFTLPSSGFSATPPYVIHVVIDDLGYDDVNFHNHQTITPTLDNLLATGVELPDFYVYKMCAPSRASTLSGRYPFHVGYYNNNGGDFEGVPLDFQLLPALLKKQNFSTHALGKWHIGWMFRNYTATYRGFDTFFGTSGNTGHYWYHFDESNCNLPPDSPITTDFVDVKGKGIIMPANQTGINGTYDSTLLTNRAMKIIQNHNPSQPLYIYLAYHNVHVPLHAPLGTVERFPYTPSDARKVTNAMLAEVDYGLGNISITLKTAGMWDNSIFIIHTDNGGPNSHACNWPFRGGKFTFWEGGVRGMAFVSSPLIPAPQRGTKLEGLGHLADWYRTVVEGIAGGQVPANTGPIPPDSFNLWPAIIGGTPSPRTEVVHMPTSNQYVNTSDCGTKGPGHGCAPSIRVGKYKLIMSWPGEDALIELPGPSIKSVAYGVDGGIVEPGTDHCISPHWKQYNSTHQNNTCIPPDICLFDVEADPHELVNLATVSKEYKEIVKNLTSRLETISKDGPNFCDIVPKKEYKNNWLPIACAVVEETNWWLPIDWDGVIPYPPNECNVTLHKDCVGKMDTKKDCKACAQEPAVSADLDKVCGTHKNRVVRALCNAITSPTLSLW